MYCNMDRWEFAECAYVHRGKHERFLLMLFILENIIFFYQNWHLKRQIKEQYGFFNQHAKSSILL